MALRIYSCLEQDKIAGDEVVQTILGASAELFDRLAVSSVAAIHLLVVHLPAEPRGVSSLDPAQILVTLNCILWTAVGKTAATSLVVVETGELNSVPGKSGAVKQKQNWGILQCCVVGIVVVYAVK